VNHEAVVAQIRKDLAAERDASIRTAVEQERAHWESRLEQELKQARLRSEAERQVSLGLQGSHMSTQVHIVNHLIDMQYKIIMITPVRFDYGRFSSLVTAVCFSGKQIV
jgi:hypothetical protein